MGRRPRAPPGPAERRRRRGRSATTPTSAPRRSSRSRTATMHLPGAHRRLHRLLLVQAARDQRRHDVPRGRRTRSCRTGCTCPSATTAAPPVRRRERDGRDRGPDGPDDARRGRPGPASGRASSSTSSSSSACSSGRATRSASPSQSTTPATTSSATCSSTTGPPATSSAGSTSRSGRSSPRASARASARGSCRRPALGPVPHRRRAAGRDGGQPRAAAVPPAGRAARPRRRASSVRLETPAMRDAGFETRDRLATSNAKNLYWSPEQQLAHHTVAGCNLRPGDLSRLGHDLGRRPRTATARCWK